MAKLPVLVLYAVAVVIFPVHAPMVCARTCVSRTRSLMTSRMPPLGLRTTRMSLAGLSLMTSRMSTLGSRTTRMSLAGRFFFSLKWVALGCCDLLAAGMCSCLILCISPLVLMRMVLHRLWARPRCMRVHGLKTLGAHGRALGDGNCYWRATQKSLKRRGVAVGCWKHLKKITLREAKQNGFI
eukprot:475839-Amphidinium_carterae.1